MISEFLENHHGGLTMCIELGNGDRMDLFTLDLGGAVHVMGTRILNGAHSTSGYRSDEPTHAAALRVGLALAMYLTLHTHNPASCYYAILCRLHLGLLPSEHYLMEGWVVPSLALGTTARLKPTDGS